MSKPEMSEAFLEGDDYDPPKAYETAFVRFSYDPGRPASLGRSPARHHEPIRTRGVIARSAKVAWIYVAQGATGAMKVGMTSDLKRRSKELRAPILHAVPVTPYSAREVETAALQLLGQLAGESEWIDADLPAAAAAIDNAVRDVGARLHVDPALSPEEARQARLSLADPRKSA